MNGIQRIKQQFLQGKVFAAYLTSGDGGIKRTLDSALALIAGGVTLLEIGVPFSDPVADGPVIQRAAERSLSKGTRMQDILNLVKEIRQHTDIPLILFSYLNPILSAARNSNWFNDLRAAGIDGILVVDCPIEEIDLLTKSCMEQELAMIHVISPSTSAERIRKISQVGQGFLYYACRKGTTGMKTNLPADFVSMINTIKNNSTLPVLAGFGIATREDAELVLEHADAVVVGSRFVKAIEDGLSSEQLKQLTSEINPIPKIA